MSMLRAPRSGWLSRVLSPSIAFRLIPAVTLVVVVGCGGGAPSSPTAAPAAPTKPAAAPTTAAAPAAPAASPTAAAAPAGGKTIKLGVRTALSVSVAKPGNEMLNSVLLAVDEWN